jgi:hypothetical protein
MTANESDQSVLDEVEYHCMEALRRAARIFDLVSLSIGDHAEMADKLAEEVFGLTDHLMLGVLDAIGRRPAPAFDYRLAAE